MEAVARERANTIKPSFEILRSKVLPSLVEEVRLSQNTNILFAFIDKLIRKPGRNMFFNLKILVQFIIKVVWRQCHRPFL